MAFGRRVTVAVDEAGLVTTTTEAIGGVKSITDIFFTAVDPDIALTGMAKYAQLGAAVALGNMLGVKAKSGQWGIALTDSLSFNLGGNSNRI